MKKLLFALAILLVVLFWTACNDNSSTKTTATDSSAADSSKSGIAVLTDSCATGDSSIIGYWQIDTAIANAMIINVGRNGRGSSAGIRNRRDNIVQQIKDSFKTNFVGFISARYREEDVERYRTKRCIGPSDSAGMVAQYFTNIVKVKLPKTTTSGTTATTSYAYYDVVTLCPPPDPCPAHVVQSDK